MVYSLCNFLCYTGYFLLKRLLFCFLQLILCAFSVCHADERITRTFKEMVLRDVNDDGVLNCIDYTVCFKVTWDKFYIRDDCMIIRNKCNDFHHLFIGVLDNTDLKTKLIFVEPQGKWNNYEMKSWWKDYDEKYNVYYETYMWLFIWTKGWMYEEIP